jgi:hypothetical protein
MMKKYIIATTLMTTCSLCGIPAHADDSATTAVMTNDSPAYAAQDDYVHKLGAGILIGEPTGASLKYWLSRTMAIDGAAGWSTHDHSDFYVHSDFLWHNFDVFPVKQGRLPLYIGVGGLVRFRNDHQDDQVGIRVPVGVSYMFENAPVDVFAEVAPAIDVTPDARGEVTGGVGVRFWF